MVPPYLAGPLWTVLATRPPVDSAENLQKGTEMLRGRAWLSEREKLNRAELTSLRWSRCEMSKIMKEMENAHRE